MAQVLCPSCGAPVARRLAAMPYAVCSYCHSIMVFGGAGEAGTVGAAAHLPADMSPIQLGTGGVADGARFMAVGRVRWGWADGAWNEWLLALADGSYLWLGEAMGQFQLLEEREDVAHHPDLAAFAQGAAIARGAELQVDGRRFVAIDIKQVACLGGEGDLPFPCPANWTMTSIDYREPKGGALSVQRDARGVSVYAGTYVDLADLSPTHLRRLDGWALPAALASRGGQLL
jgi:hypothetical protein